MMRVMSSTPSPAVAAFDWAHTYIWAFLYYFLELFGGSQFPQGGTKVKELNYYIFIVPWGHPNGVSQTHLGPTMCVHLFLAEWVTFLG